MGAVFDSLHRKILKAQAKMKHFVDNNRREVSFQEGDWVLVKLRPYYQSSVTRPNPTKLTKCYYGPFKVLDRIGTVATSSFFSKDLIFIMSSIVPFLNHSFMMLQMNHDHFRCRERTWKIILLSPL